MYKNILYPIDIVEKDSWAKSLPIVKEYAEAFKADIHVMTVVPDYGMSIVSQYFPKGSIDKVLEKTKLQLDSFVKENLNGKKIKVADTIVAQGGGVYQSIINTANKINADLIMISAHRPELKDYLLGPNAAKVVRHSEISVLVMRD